MSSSCKQRGLSYIFSSFFNFLNNSTRINRWLFEKHKPSDFVHTYHTLRSWQGNFTNSSEIVTRPTSVILAIYSPVSTENNTSFYILCLSSTELAIVSPHCSCFLSHNTLCAGYFVQSCQQNFVHDM